MKPGEPTKPALQRIRDLQSKATSASPDAISRLVIVGGGSAGWMAAATLSNVLGPQCRITLVESELIGTVGVGEATIPPLQMLHRIMGVDERQFMRDSRSTFKLGIEFVNWGRQNHRYFHPFGHYAVAFDELPLYQHWLKHRHLAGMGMLEDYSLAWQAARLDRFALPSGDAGALGASFNYAYHFDASLYAKHLRSLSEQRGVTRIEGRITQVERQSTNGFVAAVVLENGQRIEGDFFIDCSGFAALLIGQSLQVGYESWAQWLPCDRAVAVPCSLDNPPPPYTRSTALAAGWQWTIALQHRIGNGHVYSSSFTTEQEATDTLMSRLPGRALAEPRPLRFVPGRRHKVWEHNVLALGLASGFLEPLESTSLHLVQSGLIGLLSLFPDRHCHAAVRDEFNRRFALEMERIRDFLILHYKLNERSDSPMWQHCANMKVPDSLQERLDLFAHGGHVQTDSYDLFGVENWLAVHIGQFNIPGSHSGLLDLRNVDGRTTLLRLLSDLRQRAAQMPSHEAFLKRHLGAASASLGVR
jgi:tryptophan halogenase